MKILFILSPILFIIGCSGEPEPKISDEVQDFLFNNLKINEKFNELDDYIKGVDFFVDVKKVETAVQPATDKALKGL